ncbi:unnamed protein product [Rangifer tarandus platyrhynchus]|uniref:Uncharacterized protein n=2 Tax=Rangifer tarandus platyrhynchus TaxID=3082113 RepID=A0ACB0E8G3_RANTA|nr:unnamed protein product [Rangifer tarandus platyrhynchus]CAI9696791.1 unnamed protein product [Rangifer tarandus platyrhynchus]
MWQVTSPALGFLLGEIPEAHPLECSEGARSTPHLTKFLCGSGHCASCDRRPPRELAAACPGEEDGINRTGGWAEASLDSIKARALVENVDDRPDRVGLSGSNEVARRKVLRPGLLEG